ncbi:MAG: type II toxin-antitoxin system VapC family toxin [Bryobacteraceae bacterium]
MAILVDTNNLLRSLYPDHPHYSAAGSALAALQRRSETLYLAPQNLVEFWAVATRPRSENGLGMPTARAASEIATLRRFFRLLPWTLTVLEAWQPLVVDLGVSGKQTHDAHLVAIMQVYAVTDILTFNVAGFRRFPGIQVLDPAQF